MLPLFVQAMTAAELCNMRYRKRNIIEEKALLIEITPQSSH